MTLTEHFTESGWAASCRHELGETFRVDQLGLGFVDLPSDTASYDVGRCDRCGEFVTLERDGAGLFDHYETEISV